MSQGGPGNGGSELRSRLGLSLLTLLMAAALLQPLKFLHLVFLNFSVGDEGVLLAGAMRILRGQHPYRDFFVFHAPGPFYLIAGCSGAFAGTVRPASLGSSIGTRRRYS